MWRHRASAVVGCLFVVIGCGFSADQTTTGRPSSTCPKGSLHTVYKGKHKCLGLSLRKRIYGGLARVRDRGISGSRAYEVTAARFRVSISAVKAISREGSLKGWALPPSPRLPRGVPILRPNGARAASQLSARADCVDEEPGRAVVRLSWEPAAKRGTEQRVIATIFRNGFERRRFEASGTLAARRRVFDWYRVHGQAIHFWRVLTRRANGWVPSAIGQFEGPTCPVASVP
jgi:hypothetical protein